MSTDYGMRNKPYMHKSVANKKIAEDFLTKKRVKRYGADTKSYRLFKNNVYEDIGYSDVTKIKADRGYLTVSKLEKIINDPKTKKNKHLLKTILKVALVAAIIVPAISIDLYAGWAFVPLISAMEGQRMPFLTELAIKQLNRKINKHADVRDLAKKQTNEQVQVLLTAKLDELKTVKVNLRAIAPDRTQARGQLENDIDNSIQKIEALLKKVFEPHSFEEQEEYLSTIKENQTPHHKIFTRIEELKFNDIDNSYSPIRKRLENDIINAVLIDRKENLDLIIFYQSRKPLNPTLISNLIIRMKDRQPELEKLLTKCTRISNDPIFLDEYNRMKESGLI